MSDVVEPCKDGTDNHDWRFRTGSRQVGDCCDNDGYSCKICEAVVTEHDQQAVFDHIRAQANAQWEASPWHPRAS